VQRYVPEETSLPIGAGFAMRSFFRMRAVANYDRRVIDQSLRVAVVGSGPAGFYAADALLKSDDPPVEVDVIDRLPTP